MGEIAHSHLASKNANRITPVARNGKSQNATALVRRYRRIAAFRTGGGFIVRLLLIGGGFIAIQAWRLCRALPGGCKSGGFRNSFMVLLRLVFH